MARESLLGPTDPPPFTWVNQESGGEVLLTCDHASRVVPASLNGLGLTSEELSRHIGWDIGVEGVTRRPSSRAFRGS